MSSPEVRIRRFDVTESVLIGALGISLGLGLALYLRPVEPAGWADDTGAGYIERYGEARFSTGVEEYVVRDFFSDRRGGVFVDVGAGHYQRDSNTYYLESVLGWTGVAIDAQAEYASGYAAHRPGAQFVAAFVSDVDGEAAELFVPTSNLQLASGDRDMVEAADAVAEVRTVLTLTLTTILDSADVQQIDYLSLDIELHEPEALAGFDIDRFKPRLVCVESHFAVRQQLLDYFHRHGYVVVGKYLRADKNNLYFQPDAGRIAAIGSTDATRRAAGMAAIQATSAGSDVAMWNPPSGRLMVPRPCRHPLGNREAARTSRSAWNYSSYRILPLAARIPSRQY